MKDVADGLFLISASIFGVERAKVTELAARHRLPAIYPFSSQVFDAEGSTAYYVDEPTLLRAAAVYVDRILKGTQPNLKVARADEVVDSVTNGAQDYMVSQIFTGPFTGQYLIAAVYSDMAAYGKAMAANSASSDFKKLMADSAKIGAVLHERTLIIGVDL